MDLIKKYKKELLVLLGASVTAALGYVALKRIRNRSGGRREDTKGGSGLLPPSTENPNLTEKQNQKIIIERAGKYFTRDSVMSIFCACFVEMKKRLEPISRKHRNNRRKNFNNPDEYAKAYHEFIQEFDNLTEEVRVGICQQNGIADEDYMQSFMFYLENGDQEMVMVQESFGELMVGYVPSTKSLTKTQIIEAFTYQCDLVKVEMQSLISNPTFSMMLMQAPEIIMGIFRIRVNDLVYQRFGYDCLLYTSPSPRDS
eukprot:TRINITY_DN9782_c0_g1_i3.p1 TRINITY_DN9782_c0_g1~~TRINITY_DN9782_c0_g1_i3.p1  ORF type:complete len:257 (-),score=45.70 TRINITY_DN9782_c0_g1_i3:38-808(-)